MLTALNKFSFSTTVDTVGASGHLRLTHVTIGRINIDQVYCTMNTWFTCQRAGGIGFHRPFATLCYIPFSSSKREVRTRVLITRVPYWNASVLINDRNDQARGLFSWYCGYTRSSLVLCMYTNTTTADSKQSRFWYTHTTITKMLSWWFHFKV